MECVFVVKILADEASSRAWLKIPVTGHLGDPLTDLLTPAGLCNWCQVPLTKLSLAPGPMEGLWDTAADCLLSVYVCVSVSVCPKGSLEASWGPVTPLCLRLACCQRGFVMTVGLLSYRLNHHSQLFIYWPNPWQPSWHLTQTHTYRHTHRHKTSRILSSHRSTSHSSSFTRKNIHPVKISLLCRMRKEDETRRTMRRLDNKAQEGEGEAKGHLTSDLRVMAGAQGWGSEDITSPTNQ